MDCKNTLNVLKIIPDTIVDGPRMRTSIYLSGCFHHCKNCHNKESWKENSGEDITFSDIIEKVKNYGHNRITISGGDGLCYQFKELIAFLKLIKEKIPDINIWLYTGYTLDELKEDNLRKEVLNQIDALVDGKFIEALKDKNLLFRGSSNQNIWEKDNHGNFKLMNI